MGMPSTELLNMMKDFFIRLCLLKFTPINSFLRFTYPGIYLNEEQMYAKMKVVYEEALKLI